MITYIRDDETYNIVRDNKDERKKHTQSITIDKN